MVNLCDTDFARRAKAIDLFPRLWTLLRQAGAGEGDRVLDSVLILFCALVAQTPDDLQGLAQQDDFVPSLCHLLQSTARGKDPLELVSRGVTDAELKNAGILKSEERRSVSPYSNCRCLLVFHTFDI